MTNPTSAPSLELPEVPAVTGPRKLVRPRLADQPSGTRWPARKQTVTLLAHHDLAAGGSSQLGRQTELFYFQKQMQAQTVMVFVLDDGERIEGVIEWYDLNVIKVRHVTRTMIYKYCIKYIYKASDVPPREVMT